jgi:hypothetical protein
VEEKKESLKNPIKNKRKKRFEAVKKGLKYHIKKSEGYK